MDELGGAEIFFPEPFLGCLWLLRVVAAVKPGFFQQNRGFPSKPSDLVPSSQLRFF